VRPPPARLDASRGFLRPSDQRSCYCATLVLSFRIVLTYTPERDRIIHLASGPGGVDAFGSGLAQVGEDVGFGCLQEGGRVLFLTFLGEGVG
jgi:hypothetical protein